MNIWSFVIFSLLALVAAACAVADARTGYSATPLTRFEHNISKIFGFFGIGGVPPMLALAVFASTGAIAGAALDAIANLHFGTAYPPWFPANAVASGLGIGLLSARLLAISPLPATHAETQTQADDSSVAPQEAGYSF